MKRDVLLSLILATIVGSGAVFAQQCPSPIPGAGARKGKISRNFYRAPYADGIEISMNDYFGHNGSMDTFSNPPGGVMVAPADGVICKAVDGLNDCGCADASHPIGACGNSLIIVHDNDEMSAYLHMQQFSIRSAFGVADPNDLIGTFVQQGQVVGLEGDVGRTCGDDSAPRWGTCISEQQAQDLGDCGSHVHWNIRRLSTGELLEPMTCNILIYQPSTPYIVEPCESNLLCIADPQHYSGVVWSGYGNAFVYQNNDSITADNFVVQSQASIVFHAANRVRLLPGFRAGTGDAYFRAEIGPCNQTAPTP